MQKLQLSIPEPCHENWQQMTPTEQGRFCNACAKEVVDFSMMTDTELLNYFTTITHEKVCGRALPTQLDRTISWPKEPKKRLFWYWNYIVMFFMFFSKSNVAKAQGDVKLVTELNPVKPADINRASGYLTGDTIINRRVITGKVVDTDGNPVSFATIKIKGYSTGFSADANGAYSIKVRLNDVLVISGAGFNTAEIPVGTQSRINTVLDKAAASGEILVTVIAGGMRHRSLDEESAASNPKYTAAFQVKDDNSELPIEKAKIIIAKKYTSHADTVFTDTKGSYKLRTRRTSIWLRGS